MSDTTQGLSSFDIHAITHELQVMVGGYIERIHQIDNDSLLIRVKRKDAGLKDALFIRNTELICRTSYQFTPPKTPSMFAMTLRKHLLNGTISSIEQYDFDRVIMMRVTRREGVYTLVFELFKNGNIILVGPDGVIIQSLLTQRWSTRTIKAHEPYKPPSITQVNPLTVTLDEFKAVLKRSSKDLVRTLAVDLNMSGLYAEELCYRAGVDKNLKTRSMNDDDINKIYSVMQVFLAPFKECRFKPVLIKKDETVVRALPVNFQIYNDHEQVMVESFSLALQEFIKKKTDKQRVTASYDELLDRLQRKLDQQRKSLDDFILLKEKRQQEAGLLYKYSDKIQGIINDVDVILKQKDKTEGIKKIKSNSIVKEFNPEEGVITLILMDDEGEKHEVNIDFRRTVMENASLIYDESKRYKNKIKGAEEAIRETMEEIRRIEELKKNTEKIKEEPVAENIKKTFWFERYRWSISTNGNLIIGGRDAKTNDQIVKKHLKPDDRYMHADIHGAPSCIIKSEDVHGKYTPIDERTLEEASVFAACYSKAWKQYGVVNVYWVYPEQVSKTPPTGEYLPKGAFMIRGERHYYKVKLEIALGEITINGARKLMIGSPSTLGKYSDRYLVMTPGTTKSSIIAKVLSAVFNTTPDEVLRVLPPGDIRIIKTIGFTLPDEMMNK